MQDVILVGGGGHCHSVIEVIESSDAYRIVGILDRDDKIGTTVLGYDVLGCDEDVPRLSKKVKNFVITVGQIKSSSARHGIYQRLKDENVNLPTIIASTAVVSKYAQIGSGTIIHHNSFVNASAKIGDCCIINSGAIVEHDSVIGNFSHISTNAVINGDCVVGSDVFVGSGSVLNNNVAVAGGSIIGSASVVLSSLNEPGTFCGVIK